MVLSLVGSSRASTVLVAALILWPALPVVAQPMSEPFAVQGDATTELVRPGPWTSGDQGNPSSSPTYATRYRPEMFFGWSSAWLGPSKTDLGPAWSNLGGGIGVRLHRRIGVEFELSHSVESALQDVDGLRRGVTSMTLGSAKALVYLLSGPIQPYLGGGLALVWEEGLAPSYCDASSPPVCDYTRPPSTEGAYSENDAGLAISAGVRIAFTPRIFVKSEFGTYAGLVQRVSVAGGYQF